MADPSHADSSPTRWSAASLGKQMPSRPTNALVDPGQIPPRFSEVGAQNPCAVPACAEVGPCSLRTASLQKQSRNRRQPRSGHTGGVPAGALSIPTRARYRRARMKSRGQAPAADAPDPVPLCVDLDGTVIRSDLLWEGLVRFWRRHPLHFLQTARWWCHGRARLKAELARRVPVPVTSLPRVEEFVDYLRRKQASGRALYLVTAADRHAAQPVADALNLFAGVLASDGRINLRSGAKAACLVERFGERGFDYAGNSLADLAVWRRARRALVVNAPGWLVRRAFAVAEPGGTFACPPRRGAALLRALRPRAWWKNLLVLAPLVIGSAHAAVAAWGNAVATALGFSMCAVAAYLWDDLMDLDADRADPIRRARPVASGRLPLSWAAALVPTLGAAGLLVAGTAGPGVASVVGLYLGLAWAWAWRPRCWLVLRPWVRTMFLWMRVVTGHAAAGVPITPAVAAGELAFCMAVGWTAETARRRKTPPPRAVGE